MKKFFALMLVVTGLFIMGCAKSEEATPSATPPANESETEAPPADETPAEAPAN